jgi:hypothetical protein
MTGWRNAFENGAEGSDALWNEERVEPAVYEPDLEVTRSYRQPNDIQDQTARAPRSVQHKLKEKNSPTYQIIPVLGLFLTMYLSCAPHPSLAVSTPRSQATLAFFSPPPLIACILRSSSSTCKAASEGEMRKGDRRSARRMDPREVWARALRVPGG